MKTIQNSGLAAILGCLLLGLVGCSTDDEERERIPVTGEINAYDVSFYVNDRGQEDLHDSFMNGNGIIFANGGTFRITSRQTHTTYAESPDHVQIESGEFMYEFENGNMIFGYYSGCGILCPEDVCCDLSFQINGGTGEYSRASGTLTALMVENESVESPGLVLTLTGAITVPVDID